MRLSVAIQRALTFLEAHQLPTGEFVTHACRCSDMSDRAVYEPTVFTTAIVGRALARVDAETVGRMTHRALGFLVKEMPRPGIWGWATKRGRTEWPFDVDDTACVAALLQRNGVAFPDSRTAVLANRDERGLFFTWLRDPALNTPSALVAIRGQGNIDAAVNAHAVAYLGAVDRLDAIVRYLHDAMTSADPAEFRYYVHVLAVAYASAHALAAGVNEMRELRPAVREVLRTSCNGSGYGNVLLDALALTTAHVFDLAEVVPASLPRSIADRQRTDGAWARAAMFQGTPAPFFGSVELSTALCLEALHHAQNATDSRALSATCE
jgi:hypothetical protein